MKTCFKCSRKLSRSEFYAHPNMADGLLGKCKECTKADVARNYRENRNKRSEYEKQRSRTPGRRAAMLVYQSRRRAKNPDKYKARTALNNAVRGGRIKKMPCLVCGSLLSEGHHEDYSRPLEVTWLCFKHHREEHGQVVIQSDWREESINRLDMAKETEE